MLSLNKIHTRKLFKRSQEVTKLHYMLQRNFTQNNFFPYFDYVKIEIIHQKEVYELKTATDLNGNHPEVAYERQKCLYLNKSNFSLKILLFKL